MAASLGTWSSSDLLHQPWQERRVLEMMHRATVRVSPTTSVAAAAQILVERGLNGLPVVEYERTGQASQEDEGGTRAVLVGLITRSALLIVLGRSLGPSEPCIQ